MKKVSVILTSYNSQDFIELSVASINNQEGAGSHFTIELIVVDDCSTDLTISILDRLGVVYRSTERNSGGPNKGRNIGLSMATGDYICIADHDDVWKPNKIITLLPYLEQVPIVTSGYTLFYRHTGQVLDVVRKSEQSAVFFEKNITFLSKLCKSHAAQNTYLGSLIYRSSLKDILFEEHFGVVDYDWVLRMFYGRESIELTCSLYDRYVLSGNLSLNDAYRRKDYYYSLMFIETYEDQHPREVAMSRKRINGTRARYYFMVDDMRKARYYFRRAEKNLKILAYYIATYIGANLVKKKFSLLK